MQPEQQAGSNASSSVPQNGHDRGMSSRSSAAIPARTVRNKLPVMIRNAMSTACGASWRRAPCVSGPRIDKAGNVFL